MGDLKRRLRAPDADFPRFSAVYCAGYRICGDGEGEEEEEVAEVASFVDAGFDTFHVDDDDDDDDDDGDDDGGDLLGGVVHNAFGGGVGLFGAALGALGAVFGGAGAGVGPGAGAHAGAHAGVDYFHGGIFPKGRKSGKVKKVREREREFWQLCPRCSHDAVPRFLQIRTDKEMFVVTGKSQKFQVLKVLPDKCSRWGC